MTKEILEEPRTDVEAVTNDDEDRIPADDEELDTQQEKK